MRIERLQAAQQLVLFEVRFEQILFGKAAGLEAFPGVQTQAPFLFRCAVAGPTVRRQERTHLSIKLPLRSGARLLRSGFRRLGSPHLPHPSDGEKGQHRAGERPHHSLLNRWDVALWTADPRWNAVPILLARHVSLNAPEEIVVNDYNAPDTLGACGQCLEINRWLS
jgi:hypothetical protein